MCVYIFKHIKVLAALCEKKDKRIVRVVEKVVQIIPSSHVQTSFCKLKSNSKSLSASNG